MKKIKLFFQRRRDKYISRVHDDIRKSFRMEEYLGGIYITHNGIAIVKVPAGASIEDAYKLLEECRYNAVFCSRI